MSGFDWHCRPGITTIKTHVSVHIHCSGCCFIFIVALVVPVLAVPVLAVPVETLVETLVDPVDGVTSVIGHTYKSILTSLYIE
jgi:hypothetical protein